MLLNLRNAEAVQATRRLWKRGVEQILLIALGRKQLCQHLELLTSAFQSWETIKFGCLTHPIWWMSYYANKQIKAWFYSIFLTSLSPQHLFVMLSVEYWPVPSIIGQDIENNQNFPASYNQLHRSQKELYSFLQTTSPGHKKHPHRLPQGH